MGPSFSNLNEVVTKYFKLRFECFGETHKMHSAETLTKAFWFPPPLNL